MAVTVSEDTMGHYVSAGMSTLRGYWKCWRITGFQPGLHCRELTIDYSGGFKEQGGIYED